jgi:hypothetical protein
MQSNKVSNTTTGDSTELNLNIEHLKAELARIDVSIRRQVHCWQLAGQDPADNFRGLYVSDAEVEGLLARSFGSNWGQLVSLAPEEQQLFEQARLEAVQVIRSVIEKAQSQTHSLRLARLATTFGLDPFEVDALLVCLAPTLDLRYERLYGYLQDDVTRKRPTVNLVLDLLAEPGPKRLSYLAHFADDQPLFKYQLLVRGSESGPSDPPLLSQTLRVDEAVVAWLLGRYQPHADLGPYATLIQPQAGPADANELLARQVQAHLEQMARTDERPLIVFYGPDQASQEAAARLLATQLGRWLLLIDLAAVIKTEISPLNALRLALRDARLTGALLYLFGWDACLKEGALPPELLIELCMHPDLAIVAGQSLWQAEGIERDRPLFWLNFPIPIYGQRLALWQHFLAKGPAFERESASVAEELELVALAGQFGLTTGQIRDTVASARDRAAQRGDAIQSQDLFIAARAHSNPRLSTLARKIIPRYTWSDIILPHDQLAILHELVATVRGRPQVLEQWGVGRKLASSAAVTVLFAGDPGTGKTMAAEVIANELGLDLYKIDLSTVVSKYIGETEKNLERIFNEAESSNAILFFDEADAIFGKRSEVKDAHDRYANIEISYLLQRMEAYDGVTILATNLRANLDEAFTRRLQFAIDFPFPEKEDRLRIWQTLFPPEVPRDPDIDFNRLAQRFKLAGGNIRNIIVSAAYLAAADGGRVTMAHLLHGTRRELQKMGRLVGEEDLRLS